MIFAMRLSIGIATIGFILLVISLVMYYSRTKDEKFGKRFWLKKDLLSKKEYALNRSGFWLAILGIVLMYMFGISQILSRN